MDQYLSATIIAAITGLFSIITLIIQKRQDKVINHIDEQTTFIDREKEIRKRLQELAKERDDLMDEVSIIVLDTNLHILRNTQITDAGIPDEDVFDRSEKLKERFTQLNKATAELNKEYELVLDVTSKIQSEMETKQKKQS